MLRSVVQPTLPVNYEPLQAAACLEEAGLEVVFLPLFNFFPFYVPERDEGTVESVLSGYEAPVVVFLSSLYLPGLSNPAHAVDLKLSEFLKRRNPGVKIILSGSHASYLPVESFNESRSVDAVALFECEGILPDLVKSYLKGLEPEDIPGAIYRESDGKIVTRNYRVNVIENLDSLPIPAYHLLKENWKAIVKSASRMQLLQMTSRGCPYQCAFCASVRYTNKLRVRSGRHVGEELATVKDLFGDKAYFYAIKDNNFTFSPKHVANVAQQYREHDMKTDLFLTNVTSVNQEIARTTATFAQFVYHGVESPSQSVLRNVTKWQTIDQVVDACHTEKKAGLLTTLNFIVGLPEDTHETIAETLLVMSKLKLTGLADNVGCSVLVPYPGCDLFENPDKYGIKIFHFRWEDYEEVGSYPVFETKHLTRDQIFSYFLVAQSIDQLHEKRGLLRDELIPWLKAYMRDGGYAWLANAFSALLESTHHEEDSQKLAEFLRDRTPVHLLKDLPPAVSGTGEVVSS